MDTVLEFFSEVGEFKFILPHFEIILCQFYCNFAVTIFCLILTLLILTLYFALEPWGCVKFNTPLKDHYSLNFFTLLRVLLRGQITPKHSANETVIKVLICI